MSNEHFERLIQALSLIENSVQKSKTKLSWLPFWWIGYLFTIGYNWIEVVEVLEEYSWWQDIISTVMWFVLWPWFLGYTVSQ